jgi:hypothetical protein
MACQVIYDFIKLLCKGGVRMNRPSTMLFFFSALLYFAGSLFYLTQPVTPSIESFTGLSSLETAFYGQYFNTLTATLQSIIGVNLFALSLLTLYIGFRAWQDNFAWAIGLLSMLCYALPLAIVAVRSGNAFVLTLLPMVPYAFGLILAITLDRVKEKSQPKWSSKVITLK